MKWTRLVVQSTSGQLDELEAQLWEMGAVSVTVTDQADNPIFEPPPGETPLWQDVSVAGLFEEDVDITSVAQVLGSAGFEVLFTEDVQDRHWEREWMSSFEPMQFGERLWVVPTGFTAPDAADPRFILDLDPGLAFGTGTHATTRLCLEWLDSAPLKDATVLDFGTGSGILAIAAAKLGARSVIAIDNDPQAVSATTENARRNGVAGQVTAVLGDSPPAEAFDVVLANILAGPLVEMAGGICACIKDGGDLLLSGILASQLAWIEDAYRDRLRLVEHTLLDDWVSVHGRG